MREHRRVCRNSSTDENKSFVFEITNNAGHGAIYNGCYTDIEGIIDSCGHGGDKTVGGFLVRYLVATVMIR